MHVATYSRYSSDRQREASIADQQRNCARFAEREGWKVGQKYADKAISGSKADRPGYQQLLADGKAGLFDVLLVDDLSRLSRDDIEFKRALRRFASWGVRVIGVSDGYDSSTKGHKLQAGIRGLMNEAYLDDLAEKTHRGLTGRALAGLNTGGRTYGYHNVPITDGKQRDQYGRPLIVGARREIDDEQAKWVRYIFDRFANGVSPKAIADDLNRKKVPSPRGKTWAASAIYGHQTAGTGILNNEIYIGWYRWNRGQWQKDPDTGKPTRRARPEAEWIVKEMSELRIVPQKLWDRVKARQAEQHKRSANVRKALHKGARTGAGPKYLFSGLLKCGICGANYAMADGYRYGCSTNLNRGDAACSNRVRVARRLAEDRLLLAIKQDLFTPEGIAAFKQEVRRELSRRKSARSTGTEQLRRDVARVEQEIANIMTAIKAGILTFSTKKELDDSERERARLNQQLARAEGPIANVEEILPRVVDRYRDLIADLEKVASRDMSLARNTVRHLVGGEIKLVPSKRGGLSAHMSGDYAGLLELQNENPGAKAGAKLSLVAGAGNHREFSWTVDI